MLKGNKGEWSEVYVLLSLLAGGKLYQSDINLERDGDNIYEIITGYKFETDYVLRFDRDSNELSVIKIINENEELIKKVSFDEFKKLSEVIYNGIVSGKGSFRIKEVDDSLSSLQIQKLKEGANKKADIHFKIYDHRLAKETDLGFSIKSLIGGNSTLFNPGPGTNFVYKVETEESIYLNDFNRRTYKSSTKGESKLTFRIKELEKLGAKIKYDHIQSLQLWKNLKIIDGDLPEILAYSLFFRWKFRKSSLKEVVEILENKDPLNFYGGESSEQKFYEYKIMRFLTECAMGMTPEKPWLGEYDKFGGVIVAKEDGDIVVFHIYDFNLFRNYLINDTVFEQAATGEDKDNPGYPKKGGKNYNYGWLDEENGNKYIKFNLQIRFK